MHTKNELLNRNKDGSTPKRQPEPGVLQPDHSGRVSRDTPDGVVTHLSHGLGDHVRGHTHPGNIARDGAPKRVTPVKAHGSSTLRQTSFNAMGHANSEAPDASPASPLSKEPSGKAFVGRSVPTYPGQRSRVGETGVAKPGAAHAAAMARGDAGRHVLGQLIMGEALANAEPDHPAKLGRGL